MLAPKSRKHLRGYLFNVFEVARRHGGPWHGRANPIDDVDPIRVPKVARSILAPEEMEPVLAAIPAPWRGAVATTLYAGLREGEVFGLRKEDIDLRAGLLMVSRSWDAPRTKDGKALPFPVAPPLRPYLEEALRSPGALAFPCANGEMYPRHLRLGKVLRRAIAQAGLIVGHQHRCRAWRCGWTTRSPEATPPPECPRCHRRTTWSKPIPATSGSMTRATASGRRSSGKPALPSRSSRCATLTRGSRRTPTDTSTWTTSGAACYAPFLRQPLVRLLKLHGRLRRRLQERGGPGTAAVRAAAAARMR